MPYNLAHHFYSLDSEDRCHSNMANDTVKRGASSQPPVKLPDQVRDRIRYEDL
jgi:hypothetical protein